MPVEPLPCAPGGDQPPVELTTCCSPSIASAALCLEDRTTVLAVVRSGCVECAQTAEDPEVVGWIDASSSAFTAGPLPAGAAPCDAGCVDTVCRQRCDDTDGDGEADATYSELWCVRIDGTAELVLTYQGDPSQEYVPTSPVECVYGSQETETVPLCDTAPDGTVVPFLRRYMFLNGVGTYEDVDLDGQTPHVVAGTVGMCDTADSCAEPTTPAATLGLCLADGTPIAVMVTRDCDGVVSQDGWLNLTTGTWSAGDPPLGTIACGGSRSISVTGTFCDVNPDSGDVLGLVLVEYAYAADGSVESVRLVDATTGQTYTPQGEVTTCPAGVEQPERDVVQLCDTATDGTVTEFLRDYGRDEIGAIVGHTDYLLDGTPYTPAGTVGVCHAPAAEQTPCRDSSQTLLCDLAALDTVTVLDTVGVPNADGWQLTSFTAGSCTGYNPPDGPVPGPALWSAGGYLGARADRDLGAGSCAGAWNGYDAAPIRWILTKTFVSPQDGTAVVTADRFAADGGARVRVNGQDVGLYGQWNQPAVGGSSQVPVTAGPNVVEIEVRDIGGPNWLRGHLDIVMTRTRQFMRKVVTDCATGETVSVTDTTLDGDPYTVTGEVGQCEPVAECCEQPPPEQRVDVETELLCIRDEDSGDVLGQVVVERLYDDQTGDRLEQRLADPTTGDPVELPAGAVLDRCSPVEEECRDTSTVLLCDLDPECQAGGTPTVTPEPDPSQFSNWGGSGWCLLDTPGEGVAVWTGGSATLGPDVPCPDAGGETHRTIGVRLAAGSPDATDPVSVTASLRVTNQGPNAGYVGDGRLGLWDASTGRRLYVTVVASSAPVGHVQTLTITGDVPAASLAAGNIVLVLDLETYHFNGAKAWTVDEFQWSADVPATECEAQFLRTLVKDCATGETVSVVDTTLDGEPYEVQGDVAQCTAAGGGTPAPTDDPRVDTELVPLCDVFTDGTVAEFLRRITFDGDGQPVQVTDTLLDGVTAYTHAGTVGTCQAAPPEDEPCRNTSTVLLCDVAAGTETVTPTVTDTDLTGTAEGGGSAYPPLAGSWAPLWAGGALTFPQDPDASAGDGIAQVYRTVAGQITGTVPEDCATASGELTVSVRVTNNGPNPGAGGTGVLRIYRDAVALASDSVLANPPVGHVETLSVAVPATAADLTGGTLKVLLALETFHGLPKAWTADQFTISSELTGCSVQFLRNVTTDCQTGEVTAVTDTTLDGDPYTVTGDVGQCTPASSGGPVFTPCGDTEVAQLCDLTYDPQAPIPTPAGDFTLTGNVVAGNGGTTLWFAQANQEATGVAELTVSGLLPATLYQFRFASAWIGAGGADPAGNAAIYRLDVLDGATVLATRTRNVSNGSSTFPGGVLSEDLPPLPFIAPATGAVTIRFTDQTTGGGANDRDLFLMPFEVRTAVLTLIRTPFLRRFTFDCDGRLTSTEDLGLDGVTPYGVEGEVGQCAADGGAAGAVAPCDVQNVIEACRCDDADGDGFADTDYVELIGVDCDGALTPLGTYLPDLSAPYTPLAPVDCDQTDQGAPPAVGVQARRVELAAGASWSAAAHPTLQSVTAVAHAGTGTVTTADGASTLHTSEAATWSVGRADDALLTGPLTIAADTGTVTITFTTGVTL